MCVTCVHLDFGGGEEDCCAEVVPVQSVDNSGKVCCA